MNNYETILLDIDGDGVTRLTLNRVEVHNAMNAMFIAEMQDALKVIEDSAETRVVILTGAGETFCAGGDLNWMKSNINKTRTQRVEETGELANMLAALDSLSKPLIGRIQGSAYGGGIGMMSVCDILIGVEGTNFGLTEVKLGLTPATISPYVVRRIGATNARRNFFNARIFNAQEAQQMGLLTRVVEVEKLDEIIDQEIKLILKCAPGAIAATKKLIKYVDSHNDTENRSYTANALADAWDAAEGKEGIDAFLNKRKAEWNK
ncbi:MAG: crotonase/enoyl-CoA hydratase family protein [Methylococcales bacterium]